MILELLEGRGFLGLRSRFRGLTTAQILEIARRDKGAIIARHLVSDGEPADECCGCGWHVFWPDEPGVLAEPDGLPGHAV